MPVVAAAIAAAIIWTATKATSGGVPACTWRIGKGTDVRQGRMFDEVAPESALSVSYWCDEPRFVYVFSHSSEDGTLLLWPSPLLQSDKAQPLPAGSHVLPGRFEGNDQYWTSRSGIHAVTTFVAVAARERVEELEALAPKVRQWSNSVFPDHTMLVTQPKVGMDVAGPPGSANFPAGVLARAASRDHGTTLANGPMHPDSALPAVWTATWTCVEKKP